MIRDTVTPKEIVEFVRNCGDMKLSTLWRKQRFTVRAVKDELEYIPSTGKPRRDRQTATNICEEFSRTNSPHPGHYSHLSKHASYTLAVIDDYLRKTRGHGIIS